MPGLARCADALFHSFCMWRVLLLPLLCHHHFLLCVCVFLLCVCVCPAGAQCAHAAVGVIGMYKSSNEALFRHWERHGQPKIALKIRDDQEMVRAVSHLLGQTRQDWQLPKPRSAQAQSNAKASA